MYQTVNSSLYSGASVAVHANVYSTQRGIDYSLSQEGQIWLVENETQFRDAVLNALSGDTIKLADNIKIDGSIDFGRRVHIDTDIYNLEITGDLVYDFVEMGSLNINTSSVEAIEHKISYRELELDFTNVHYTKYKDLPNIKLPSNIWEIFKDNTVLNTLISQGKVSV